jgi:hypothetical protein
VPAYTDTDMYNRTCFHCNTEVEDEFHIILKCHLYFKYWEQFIKINFCIKSHLFSILFNSSHQRTSKLCVTFVNTCHHHYKLPFLSEYVICGTYSMQNDI